MHFIEILVPTDNYAFDDQDLNSGKIEISTDCEQVIVMCSYNIRSQCIV